MHEMLIIEFREDPVRAEQQSLSCTQQTLSQIDCDKFYDTEMETVGKPVSDSEIPDSLGRGVIAFSSIMIHLYLCRSGPN